MKQPCLPGIREHGLSPLSGSLPAGGERVKSVDQKGRCVLALGILFFLLLATARAQLAGELPPGVELHEYTSWANCLFLNASELPVQTVIVPAVGGRIVHFSYNGQNILLENSG